MELKAIRRLAKINDRIFRVITVAGCCAPFLAFRIKLTKSGQSDLVVFSAISGQRHFWPSNIEKIEILSAKEMLDVIVEKDGIIQALQDRIAQAKKIL